MGGEPEIVALENQGDTFKVVKKYDLLNASDCVYDWSFQSLTVSLVRIVREWEEWAPFIAKLFNEAILEKAEEGKTLFAALGNEDIEA